MSRDKKINVQIHNNCNMNSLSNIVNKYHVDLIENYLDSVPLAKKEKIEVINKIIDILRFNNLTN